MGAYFLYTMTNASDEREHHHLADLQVPQWHINLDSPERGNDEENKSRGKKQMMPTSYEAL